MKRRIFIVLIAVTVVLAGLLLAVLFNKNHQHKFSENGDAGFFTCIPVHSFTLANIPAIEVILEDKKYLVEIDLGFSGDISLLSPIINNLEQKTFVGKVGVFGFQGHRYEKNVYKIPSLKIEQLTFSPIAVEEKNEMLEEENLLLQNVNEQHLQTSGSLGWKLFINSCLYLDFANSRLILCDSIQTFNKENFSLEDFVEVPLLINQDFLEFDSLTSLGPLRCCLDTGSTTNLIHREDLAGLTMHERLLKEEHFIKLPSFNIGNQEFGPVSFRQLPLKFPAQIEAMLGMEFLINNRVFIDFVNERLYFAPSL